MPIACYPESYLIQDEPEAAVRFQHKMSLKGRGAGMLGVDHQHGGEKAHEPGADPGVPGGKRGDSI
jgi:ribosomal protein L2